MKMNKKIIIILSLVLLAIISLFVVAAGSETQDELSRTPTKVDSNASVAADSCAAAGGTWLPEYKECEYVSRQWCSEQAGNFQECTSACRHQVDVNVCTSQCVPVCQL